MAQYYNYYEEGQEKRLSLLQIKKMYVDDVDAQQKESGTTFKSWLDEMVNMQILCDF